MKDVARKTCLYFFWILLFGMKYSCMLVSQTCMAHPRFHFFFFQWIYAEIKCQLEMFIHIRLAEKSRQGMGAGAGRTYFLKTLELLRIYFSKKVLEFLGLLLFPWRFWAKENFTPGNTEKLCYTPGKFHFLSWSPLDILHAHAVSSILLQIPCLQPPAPAFLSEIAHSSCLNCYFLRVCKKKFYKAFFLIISSDILCIIPYNLLLCIIYMY